MEKNNSSIIFIFLIILLFAVLCFSVYYIVNYKKHSSTKSDDSDNVVITDELKNDVTSTIDSYLVNIFMEHSAKYCGKLNYDDFYFYNGDSSMSYYKNETYNSIDEIKKVYSSIISDEFFTSNLKSKFLENNGKLYCGLVPRGSLTYSTGNVFVTDIQSVDNSLSVKGYYNTDETDMSPSERFDFNVLLIKENSLWVIDSYSEV